MKCEEYDPEKPFFIWLPRILGICPLISLAYGFHKAAAEVKPAKEVLIFSSNLFLHSFSLFCLILAILLLLITIYRTKWFCSDKWLGAVTRDGLFAKKTENIFVTASFIIFAAFTVPSMSSFPSLGTLAIVVLCLVIYKLRGI